MADQQTYNRQLIEEFRTTRITQGVPLEGRPILLLGTTGAKSGQPRTTPLMYVVIDERLFAIASNAGAPTHPDWYRNVLAHPDVLVEQGAETYPATAIVIQAAEREDLWAVLTTQYPFFAEHQAKTAREIPLVELKRQVG